MPRREASSAARPDDQEELRELRRLELEPGEGDPAGGAVHGVPGGEHDGHAREDEHVERPVHPPHPARRDRGDDEHPDDADPDVDELVAVHVARVVPGRVLHDPEPERRDREHGREHQVVQVADVVLDHRLWSWPLWKRYWEWKKAANTSAATGRGRDAAVAAVVDHRDDDERMAVLLGPARPPGVGAVRAVLRHLGGARLAVDGRLEATERRRRRAVAGVRRAVQARLDLGEELGRQVEVALRLGVDVAARARAPVGAGDRLHEMRGHDLAAVLERAVGDGLLERRHEQVALADRHLDVVSRLPDRVDRRVGAVHEQRIVRLPLPVGNEAADGAREVDRGAIAVAELSDPAPGTASRSGSVVELVAEAVEEGVARDLECLREPDDRVLGAPVEELVVAQVVAATGRTWCRPVTSPARSAPTSTRRRP